MSAKIAPNVFLGQSDVRNINILLSKQFLLVSGYDGVRK